MMRHIGIVDTTLRDGEQAAGMVFSIEEKLQVAQLLDQAGVQVIEAGIPAMGGAEKDAITRIAALGLKAQVTTWNRACIADIKHSLDCGVNHVHISAPVSDLHIQHKLGKNRLWILDNLRKTVQYAQERGCQVSVGAEDATRAEFDFLVKFLHTAEELGVNRVRIADTVGIMEPFTTRQFMVDLVKETEVPLEFHAHNDFGLATANALAAWLGGAQWISTTVNGIGERAGNTCLSEVVKSLEMLYSLDCGLRPSKLKALQIYVDDAVHQSLSASLGNVV